MATHAVGVEERVFHDVLGASLRSVEDAVIAGELVGEPSLSRVVERLAALLGVAKGDVLRILDVSRTKVSRNPSMDVDILDRAGSALKLYGRVAAMIGHDGASRWLGRPHAQLGGRRPVDLMASHLGERRVDDLITALEDGTFL